jgi:hypothetical protein
MAAACAACVLIGLAAAAWGQPREPRPQVEQAGPAEPGADGPVRPPSRRSALRAAWGLVRGLLVLFLCLCLLVMACERRFVFYPMRYPHGDWDARPAGAEDCRLTTSDGLRLHAWWLSAGPDAPVLLWLHGNAGNISHRAENQRLLARSGMSSLLVDYRGYGRSEGKPTEQGIYLDAEAAYDYLTRQRGVPPEHIVAFGQSMGAAAAVHLALVRPVRGLILESPFASARAMARHIMPLLPVWPFVRTRMDNVGRIRSVRVPVLVLHGDRDEVVPFEQGMQVFEAAPEPKRFYRIEGAGHNDTWVVGGDDYFRTLADFCRRCAGAR